MQAGGTPGVVMIIKFRNSISFSSVMSPFAMFAFDLEDKMHDETHGLCLVNVHG
jgi:hypothetical protein